LKPFMPRRYYALTYCCGRKKRRPRGDLQMNGQRRGSLLFCLVTLATCPVAATGAPGLDQATVGTQPVDEATRHNASGLSKVKVGDMDGAIAEYSEAIRLDPTFAEAFNNRGLAEARKGDLDAALRDYSQAISLNPRYAAAFYNRGLAYRRKQDFDQAIEDYSRALAINPTSSDAYDDRGLAKVDKGDFDGAIADLTTALTLAPKSARAYNNRGWAQFNKKDFDAAVADYDQAVTLDPKYALAYINRADAKASQKDRAGAIADYTTAIILDPKRTGAFYGRGLAKLNNGDSDGAIADFTQTVLLNPKHARAFTYRCQAHRRKRELDAALADCTEAIALDAKSQRALTLRGQVKSSQGDKDGALKDLSDAIAVDPRAATAYYERCLIEEGKGELDRAIGDCTEAISIDSTFAFAYFERARTLERRGDLDQANTDYAKAQQLDAKLVKPATFVAGIGTGASAPTAGTVTGGVYQPGGDVTLPKVTHEVRPQYTTAALEAQVHGTVVLNCVVAADGHVRSVEVKRSLDLVYGLDLEAIKAAKQWTFEPGTKNGQPVPVLITIELAFSIAGPSTSDAPLSLPDAFLNGRRESAAGRDDSWQEQTFDLGTIRTHIAYPKGWTTTTGLPQGAILLQNPKEPFGVLLAPPIPTPDALDRAASVAALQGFADSIGKRSGRSIDAFGQVRAGGRLWLWLDFGQLRPASVDTSAQSPFGDWRALVDATRAWLFFTTVGKQGCGVTFFVSRLANVSAADMNRATDIAGGVFAKVLESLSFEPR
jgi:TonB family protein